VLAVLDLMSATGCGVPGVQVFELGKGQGPEVGLAQFEGVPNFRAHVRGRRDGGVGAGHHREAAVRESPSSGGAPHRHWQTTLPECWDGGGLWSGGAPGEHPANLLSLPSACQWAGSWHQGHEEERRISGAGSFVRAFSGFCPHACCVLQGGLGAAIENVEQAAISMPDRWRVHIKASSSSSTTNLSLARPGAVLGARGGGVRQVHEQLPR